MKSKTRGLSVLVIQVGARRGYAVPRMFNEAGVLNSFFTTAAFPDANEFTYLRSMIGALGRAKRAAVKRRVVRGVAADKVKSFPIADIHGWVASRLSNSALDSRLAVSHALGRYAIKRIPPEVNAALIVDDSGGPDLVRALKSRGIFVAMDVVVTPTAHEQTALAAEDFPDWACEVYSFADRQRFIQMYENLVSEVDLVLYPSLGVLEGLRTLTCFDESRSACVPYPLGTFSPLPMRTEPGRILFAGSDPLRKGLPYLAMAGERLRERGVRAEIVVAGRMPENIRELELCRSLTFLGHLSREQMAEEMSRADVFCLPSLAEGTAQVTLEALASGVPNVVTLSAGAPVEDGVNGFIVPERNTGAIVDALQTIIEDRGLRSDLSKAAKKSSSQFTELVVRKLLIAQLNALAGTS